MITRTVYNKISVEHRLTWMLSEGGTMLGRTIAGVECTYILETTPCK
jgi:hypothetical protein